MAQFEVNKSYGNDLTVEVIKRTAKTVTINTCTWGVRRVKVRSFINGKGSIIEYIHFKSWMIDATEFFNEEIATEYENAMYRAYYL